MNIPGEHAITYLPTPAQLTAVREIAVMTCAVGWILTLIGSLAANSAAATDDAVRPAAPIDFARDIQPIFARRCVSCHGAEAQKGGLRLDRKDRAIAGGDSGPAFEPGQSDASLLLDKVAADDPAEVMPPKGERLTPEEIASLKAWIHGGALWPSEAPGGQATRHWSFTPPIPPVLPEVKGPAWCRNPIDRFVLARLEREGVQPAPQADARTLIRRLHLDLIGLPPAPREVAAFVQDTRPDAYETLVDRLLASPHLGERWGRHWLDLARFADSDGYEKDSPRPFAHRYRDWVIDAINRDLPFDRFTIEQLAGDLLPNATIDQRAATGFHRNTLTNKEGGADQEEFRVAAIVDRTNTTGAVWLGLTMGCAQCHSHKYDPISNREYYQLFAFFNSGKEVDIDPSTGEPAGTDPGEKKAKVAASRIPTLAEAPGGRKTHILTRGDFLRPGAEVQPGTPACLPPLDVAGPRPTRLDLARWLVKPDHPLTARVEVNRAWRGLFGRPLVASVDDFGARGEPPSHPELLDWLATELPRLGWGRKALIRLIVTSATYRQSSMSRPELTDRDPNNVWLARQNRFRPEAEVIRDLFLATGGLLVPRIGGPSVRPPQPPGIAELTYANSAKWTASDGPDRHRRGLYTWFQRTSPYPMLMTFDAPEANVCAVKRERSDTPLQALTLLNDEVFVECAQGLAGRMIEAGPSDAPGRIRTAYSIALGRQPDHAEVAELAGLLDVAASASMSTDELARLAGKAAGKGATTAEAAAWVVVARAILNLDEFVTRD